MLLQQELITAFELYRLLQQNLARKLLDAFTWRSGTYAIISDAPPADSTLKIKPAQLVVTGVMKFSPQEEVDSSIIPLIGKRLGVHPAPVFPLDDIRLNSEQSKVIERLAARARIDEIAASVQLPYEDVSRLIYALAILGIVGPEDSLPRHIPAPPPKKQEAPPPAKPAATPADLAPLLAAIPPAASSRSIAAELLAIAGHQLINQRLALGEFGVAARRTLRPDGS